MPISVSLTPTSRARRGALERMTTFLPAAFIRSRQSIDSGYGFKPSCTQPQRSSSTTSNWSAISRRPAMMRVSGMNQEAVSGSGGREVRFGDSGFAEEIALSEVDGKLQKLEQHRFGFDLVDDQVDRVG